MFKNLASTFRKVLVATATAALAFSGLSAAPAAASTPVYASGNSVINQTHSYSLPMSSSSLTLPAGVTEVAFSYDYNFGSTWVAANIGKTVYLDVQIKNPSNQAVPTTYSEGAAAYVNVNPNLNFCVDPGNWSTCTASQNTYDGSPETIVIGADKTSGYAYLNFQLRGGTDMNSFAVSTLPAGTYTVTVSVKSDGVTQSPDGLTTGLRIVTSNANIVIPGGDFTPAITADSVSHEGAVCIDSSKIAVGDTLTSRLYLNDTLQTGWVNRDWYYRKMIQGSGTYRTADSNGSVIVTQNDIDNGLQAFVWLNGDQNYKTVGTNYTMDFQVVDQNGDEVSGDCTPGVPGKPTISVGSGGALSGTFSEGAMAMEYQCAWYLSSDQVTPVLTSWAMPGMNSPGYSCGLSAPVVGSKYVLKVRSHYATLFSAYSAASDELTAPAAGYTVSPAISGLTTAGKISQVSNDIVGESTADTVTAFADGKGGILQVYNYGVTMNCPPNCAMPNGNFKMKRSSATGMDSTFAGSGSVTWDPTISGVMSNANVAWYGASDKWTMTANGYGVQPAFELIQGSFASATTTTYTVAKSQFEAACATMGTGWNLKSSSMNSGGSISVFPVSAPTAKQHYILNCWKEFTDSNSNKFYPSTQLLITIDDATHVNVIRAFGEDTNDANSVQIRYSVNPAATGTTTAVTFLVTKTKITGAQSTPPFATTGTVAKREILRMSASGVFTNTDSGWTGAGTSIADAEILNVPTTNDGSFYVLHRSGQTTSIFKVSETGAGSALVAIVNDKPTEFANPNYSFPTGTQSGNSTDISLINRSFGLSQSMAVVSVKTATGASKTGEILSATYSSGKGIMNTFVLDPSTKDIIWWHSNAANGGKLTLYKWRNPLFVPVAAVPTVSVQVSGKATNTPAVGTKVTITGTNLGSVTAVKFGNVTATIGTRSATSMEVTVPAGSTGTVNITLTHTGGSVTAGSYTYVGATKVTQTVTLSSGANKALVGDADRTLSATVSIVGFTATPSLTYSSTTTGICTVVSGKLHFVAPGNCSVKVVQASSSWAAEGVATATIAVRKPQTVTVNSLSAAEKLASVEGVFLYAQSTSGLTLTYTFSTPLVCNKGTFVANHVLNIKAGTCTIVVSQAGDGIWAPASATITYTVGAAGTAAIVDAGNVSAPVTLPNNGTKVNVLSEVLYWNKSLGDLNVRSRGVWVGPITATATFKIGTTDYTCRVSYGVLKGVTDSTANQVKGFSAPNMCAGTATTDKAALAALKKLTSVITVKIVVVRDLRNPANYAVKGQNTTRTIYVKIG